VREFHGPSDVPSSAATLEEDFTLIPKVLDQKIEKYDTSNALSIDYYQNWTEPDQGARRTS
jgi:hypothetical protein